MISCLKSKRINSDLSCLQSGSSRFGGRKQQLRDRSFFMGRGGGALVSGGHPKIFELKGWPSQKLKTEEVFYR